jgi:1-acyl-sn-glycerol-3-phosphate acyltransferase
VISFQTFACLCVYPYYHAAYRIRAWGNAPKERGSTLLIANHQHDNDDKVTISHVQLHSHLNRCIRVLSGRRLFEPGFMARKWRWLEWLLGRVNTGALFRGIGMVPIENEIRSRSLFAFAFAVFERHGDLPLAAVFHADALEPLAPDARDKTLAVLFRPEMARTVGATIVTVRALREPYRGELIEKMRGDIEHDLAALEAQLRSGDTLWLTPEGRFTKTGAMGRFRTALWRLWPVAESVYVIAISYDVFVSGRLSMLFRVVPPADRADPVSSLAAARPVTVSQLLADWLCSTRALDSSTRALDSSTRALARVLPRASARGESEDAFTESDAVDAVQVRLAALPAEAWVDPELRESPSRMTRAALDNLVRLGIFTRDRDRYQLTGKRTSPHFPEVPDIVAYQAVCFRETMDGLNRIKAGLRSRAVAGPTHGGTPHADDAVLP